DSVWLFGLDGALDPVSPASSIMALPRRIEGDANLDNGAHVFYAACAFCHGDNGRGGQGAGPASSAPLTRCAPIQAINEGRNEMPPFGAVLTSEQIRDVGAYVLELR